jgi:hypothetical protein
MKKKIPEKTKRSLTNHMFFSSLMVETVFSRDIKLFIVLQCMQ